MFWRVTGREMSDVAELYRLICCANQVTYSLLNYQIKVHFIRTYLYYTSEVGCSYCVRVCTVSVY